MSHPETKQDHRQLRFYRHLILAAGTAYLIWWVLIRIILPESFNPLGSRLFVVFLCLSIYWASFLSDSVSKHISHGLSTCLGALTFHYFYLFHRNQADINWVVGSYILVIAASACLQTKNALLTYASFTVLLSLILTLVNHTLIRTIFLPGMVTILTFVYFGLSTRHKLILQSQEQTLKLQSLFDAAFEGIVVHDHGTILDANESFARIFGYQRSEVLGKNVCDFSAPECLAVALKQVNSDPGRSYETLGISKSGLRIPIEVIGKNHILQGKAVRLAAVYDLSERKKSEKTRILYESANAALKLRDELITIISHELKTPLTTIKLQTQMAKRNITKGDPQAFAPEKIRRLVDQTDRQANRLITLVEDMLDISKISMGKLKINQERINFSNLTEEVIHSAADLIKQSGSEIQIRITPEITIFGDPFRMEQVILNLLTNAVKYGRGRPIQVSLQVISQEARLEIQDQGIGIANEDQIRIFDRFERAVSAENISGLGLGLYICKQILDAHQGKVEVESTLGTGSKFRVILPLWQEKTLC